MTLDQLVPHHAIEGGEQGGAARRVGYLLQRRGWRQTGKQGMDAAAQRAGGAIYPLVDQPGDPRRLSFLPPLEAHAAQYRLMDGLGKLYRRRQGLNEQSGQLANVCKMPEGGGLRCCWLRHESPCEGIAGLLPPGSRAAV